MSDLNRSTQYVGADIPLNFTIQSVDGSVLTGSSVNFVLSEFPGNPPLLDLGIGTGLTITTQTPTEINLTGNIAYTTFSTPTKKTYFYYVRIQTPDGRKRITREYRGTFDVTPP